MNKWVKLHMNMMSLNFKKTCCVLIFLVGSSIISSCTEKKHEFPLGCDVEDLLVQLSDLPKNSSFSSSGRPIPDSTINSAGVVYYLGSHLISHATYWYSLQKYSIRKYDSEVAAAELINPENQSIPTEFTDGNLLADSYNIECGHEKGILQCIFVGRYKNYVIVLNSEIAEDALSFADYQQVIKGIDQKTFACE